LLSFIKNLKETNQLITDDVEQAKGGK